MNDIIIVGPQGSGKTTIANILINRPAYRSSMIADGHHIYNMLLNLDTHLIICCQELHLLKLKKSIEEYTVIQL